ncbi:MAG TPA: DUF4349 domain-containing protein [Candidatus Udaeobacter sp.]|nr:DUF4349 domain-containing protein [Candidatus Udaeobacter sp.]
MNTSTHPVANEEVMAFLDGELSTARAQSVSDHLRHCADCSTLAAQLGETKSQLAGWQVESLPPAAEAKIQEAAGKRLPRPQGFSSILFQRVYSALGSGLRPILALSFLAIVALLLSPSHKMRPDSIFERDDTLSPSSRVQTRKSISQNATALEDYSALTAKLPAGASYSLGTDTATEGRPRATLSRSEAWSTTDESSEDKSPTPAARPAPADIPIHQPMIARSVSLTIVTKDFASSRASLEAILARHHGYSAQLTANTAENVQRFITASLRVPTNELAATLAELKALGHVETESQSGEEVTQQHADLVARLKNSRETEHRLQAILLQRTGKITDVLAVEEEISRVRGEIEEMEAEQKSLEHRVDFATIELRISEEYKAKLDNSSPSASTRIHNSLVAGYKNATETLLGFVLFFAESGPTLLIRLVILLVPAMLLVRRFRRAAAAW